MFENPCSMANAQDRQKLECEKGQNNAQVEMCMSIGSFYGDRHRRMIQSRLLHSKFHGKVTHKIAELKVTHCEATEATTLFCRATGDDWGMRTFMKRCWGRSGHARSHKGWPGLIVACTESHGTATNDIGVHVLLKCCQKWKNSGVQSVLNCYEERLESAFYAEAL